ncbi:MAG: hypothetical protein AABY90_10040 [Nitrospirota bacterium]|jgi:hypothetical protein
MVWQPLSDTRPHGETLSQPHGLPSPLLAVIRRSPLQLHPNDGLVLVYGHPAVLRLGLYAAADRVLAGEPILYLDGANAFDPFVITRLARASGVAPRTLLLSIHVSRAFTCHQMASLITERLEPAFRAHRARIAILSGPLETFYDEAVPHDEVARLAHTMLTFLRHVARCGFRLLCLCPPAPVQTQGRRILLQSLWAQADRVIGVGEADDALVLREEAPGSSKRWAIPRAVWEST